MTKLHIKCKHVDGSQVPPMEIELINQLSEDIFKPGHESELEIQKPFISCLIWGTIGFAVNKPIDKLSVCCVIEFDNGLKIDVPRDVVYDISRIIGA